MFSVIRTSHPQGEITMTTMIDHIRQLSIKAGGPGSGPHGGTSGKNNGLDSHPDHSWLKENGWKRTAGDTGKPQWEHARHPGKSFSTGKAADLQEAHFKGKIKAGGPGSGKRPGSGRGPEALHNTLKQNGFKSRSFSESHSQMTTKYGHPSGSTAEVYEPKNNLGSNKPAYGVDVKDSKGNSYYNGKSAGNLDDALTIARK